MVVDASVWVGWLLAPDEHHVACRGWLAERARAGDVLAIPSIAAAVARRVRTPPMGRLACAQVLRFPRLEVYELSFARAMTAVGLSDATRMRGADLAYVQLALELDAPLVTLDREQAVRGAATVTTTLLADDSGAS